MRGWWVTKTTVFWVEAEDEDCAIDATEWGSCEQLEATFSVEEEILEHSHVN